MSSSPTSRLGLRLLREFWADSRVGARALRRSPAFAVAATLTLALGLTFQVTMFSIADGLLFRPLPYGDPGRLFLLLAPRPSGGGPPWVPGAAVIAVTNSRTMAAVAGVTASGTLEPRRPDDAIWQKHEVTEDFFDVVRVTAALGRTFAGGDSTRQPTRTGLLTFGAWHRRFGGDAGVLGTTLEFVDERVEVVGVLPEGFIPPYRSVNPDVEIYIADQPFLPAAQPNFVFLSPVIRLEHGVSVEEAQAELDVMLDAYWRTAPAESRARVVITPLHVGMFESWRTTATALVLAGSLVLALVTVNLTNLLLAQGLGRRREIAVRAALGASAGRVSRQFAAESLVLAVLAAGLAIVLVVVVQPVVPRLLPSVPAAVFAPGFDWRSLVVLAALACLATFVLVGTGVRQASLINVREAMAGQPGRHAAARPLPARVLVAVEVTMATVVLVAAFLLSTSFGRLASRSLGFDERDLYVATTEIPADAGGTQEERFVRQSEAFTALRRTQLQRYEAVSCAVLHATCRSSAGFVEATSGFLAVAGAPVLRGRMFTPEEERGRVPVAVVSSTYAAATWPGQEPLGQRVEAPGGSTFEVIGVASDIRHRRDASAVRMILVPWGTLRLGTMSVITRTPSGRQTVHQSVSLAVRPWLKDARVSVARVSDRALTTPRMVSALVSASAVLALLVATIGVFGIQAVSVAARRAEVAVRIAVGGRPAQVTRQVVSWALMPVLAGMGSGLLLSVALASWTSRSLIQEAARPLLYGTSPYDFAAWFGAAIVILVVALVAAWLPARGLSQADPVAVLKVS